jgi:hypothetical protein
MWDVAFLLDCVLYFIFHVIGPTDLHISPAPTFKTLEVFYYIFGNVEVSAPHKTIIQM